MKYEPNSPPSTLSRAKTGTRILPENWNAAHSLRIAKWFAYKVDARYGSAITEKDRTSSRYRSVMEVYAAEDMEHRDNHFAQKRVGGGIRSAR